MTIHLGNVPASSTLYIPFATYDANGASLTMSGFATSDILIYKNGSVTQRASVSGFTLLDTDGTDFDGVTGLQGFSIDLSDNTDAGFYSVGAFYWVVVSTVTVNAQTVTLIAATFRIGVAENTAGTPVVDVGRINNVAASSVTAVNANVGTTQPVNFTGTGASALAKSDMVDIAGAAVSTSSAQIGVNAVQAGGVAWASGAIVAGAFAASAIARAAFAADTGLQPARSSTAQAGAASTITLDASASATDNLYKGMLVFLTGGTGAGQARIITAYVGSTKVATVSPAWITNPDNTSTFAVRPVGPADLEAIVGAAVSTTTAQLGVNAVQHGGTAQTGRDIGASVLLSAGTGTGQLDFTSGVVKASLVQILGTALTETAGQIAAAFKKFFDIASPTSTMNVITTVTTATTATNLTNAPTAGDFTATMKTSLNNATPSVTVSDKTGFSLSSAGVQAIWDALTSALTTVGSIGKMLVTNITGDIYARLGAPVGASISADIAGEPAALLDLSNGVETGLTLRQALRLALAALAGKLSGAGTGTEVMRNAVADSKARITATVDSSGNRSAITTDLT